MFHHATTSSEVASVALLGLPTDEASSFVRGAALGPIEVRRALGSDSSNLFSEAGVDLEAARGPGWIDAGDLVLSGGAETRAEIERGVGGQLVRGRRVLSLGGDHAVTYPILRAYREHFEPLTVVQIDAHPDLYDSFEGDRFSHACPFARVMEEGLVDRLVQVGIRTATAHQREQATRFGVEWVPRKDWGDPTALALDGSVYLSIDLDGFDPAFAPGVAHLEPGGLTTREVLAWVWGIQNLVGADVVELNPERDLGGITGFLAAKLVKELLTAMLASSSVG